MRSQAILTCVAFLSLLAGSLAAADFSIAPSMIEVSATAVVDHRPLRIPVDYTTTPHVTLTATSDSLWAAPSVDADTGTLVVELETSTLINRSNTATITVSDGSTTDQVFIKATVSTLNIVTLADDPVRNRTYAIQQDGQGLGSLISINPLDASCVSSLTMGTRPADVAISADGSEAAVICSVTPRIVIVDLASFEVKETIPLATFGDCGETVTTADIAFGPNGVIYYTDAAWAPALHVLKRSTREVIQTVATTTSYYGFGDIAVTPAGDQLFAWAQYGWHAGLSNSSVNRFSIAADGKITFTETSPYPQLSVDRDPLNTPVMISADGEVVVIKKFAFASSSVAAAIQTFNGPVYAMTPEAEIVSTNNAIHDLLTGDLLASLPVATTVQCTTSDYARLVYFDPGARAIKSFDLLDAIGDEILGRAIAPVDGSIALAPTRLSWSALPGIDRYQVYLGTDQAAVTAADRDSPLYLGEAIGSSIDLTATFTAGTTYYWRVDAVTDEDVSHGAVYSFTVSTVSTSQGSVTGRTVHGHANYPVPFELNSVNPGETWSLASASEWIHIEDSSGVTPATARVRLDASALEAGVHRGSITLTTSAGNLTVPVQLTVDALNLTKMRSDPDSALVYAISEAAATSRAYLLEIDAVTESVLRVVPAGQTATDLAIHPAENRIYVTNWQVGKLRAFDRTTLAEVRSYPFSAYGSSTYYEGDAYTVAAGGAGRVMVEEMDQWITMRLYNTDVADVAATYFAREGGGQFAPERRYYYHGENNSSGAQLLKLDTLADTISLVKAVRVEHTTYYGSRVVVVADDGKRIFWAGGVFTPELVEEWALKDIIYSASGTGRYAFAESKIYDVDAKAAILGMPQATKVSAFNSTAEKLVVQVGEELCFYTLSDTISHPAPVLALDSIGPDAVKITWTDRSLETGFTLQLHKAGEAGWTDVTPAIAANTTSYTFTQLLEETTYEFRIKADSPTASSSWSNVLSVTVPIYPPDAPDIYPIYLTHNSVTLSWWTSSDVESVTVERRMGDGTEWTVLGTVATSEGRTYRETELTPQTTYVYRAKAMRRGVESVYSGELEVTTLPLPNPPVFLTQPPRAVTVEASRQLYLQVQVSGAEQYQWYKDGQPIPYANSPWLQIEPAKFADAGAYHLVATNAGGSTQSNTAQVTVAPFSGAGTYFGSFGGEKGQWAMVIGSDGKGTFIGCLNDPRGVMRFNLSLSSDGSFRVTSVLMQGAPPTGLVAAALPFVTVNARVENGAVNGWLEGFNVSMIGTKDPATGATSAIAGLYSSVGVGQASGTMVSIVGSQGNVLMVVTSTAWVDGGQGTCSSTGSVLVTTMSQNSITAKVDGSLGSVIGCIVAGGTEHVYASILPRDRRTDRLVNISSRGVSGQGERVMIGGFVVSGTAARTLLIRGAGPALADFDVTGAEADPTTTLFDEDGAVVDVNDNWETAPNLAELKLAVDAVGAFGFHAGGKDAAILITLPPGTYTAITSGKSGTNGVVLTEVYDVTAVTDGSAGVVNLSIRAHVGTNDDVVVAGFVVQGNSPKQVLVRAVGPTLANFMDPAGLLADPSLTIMQDSKPVVANNDWNSADASLVAAMKQVGAFDLPDNSKDAAILVTLMPGVYSAHAFGNTGATGVALVEIYQLE